MTQIRYCAQFNAHWLKLRDERGCDGGGQWILSNVGMAYSPDSEICFGDLLEKVCDPGGKVSREARASHHLSVKAFCEAQEEQKRSEKRDQLESSLWSGLHAKLLDLVNAAYQSTLSVGCHTFPYSNPDILPHAFTTGLSETAQKLLSQSYVTVNEFLDPTHLAAFVDEARKFHEDGKMEPADPHQATSGQRDDYICWLDETKLSFNQPAIHKAIKKLKAVAHALSPFLSQLSRQLSPTPDHVTGRMWRVFHDCMSIYTCSIL